MTIFPDIIETITLSPT